MKNQLFTAGITLCLAVIAGAEEPRAIPEAAPTKAKTSGPNRVEAIDAYVRGVEKKAASYQRKEAMLSADRLKKITNEPWKKIDSYWDGTTLKRMRLYPEGKSKKTEEFYYDRNTPVFVFLEENGADRENRDANARGEKFYFSDGKLIAVMGADGKAMDIKSAESKKMADKLKKEAQAFRATAK